MAVVTPLMILAMPAPAWSAGHPMSLLSLLQHAPRPHLRDVVDILLVTYLTYRIARLIRGTRAWTVLMGILAFLSVLWLAHLLGLRALSFLLDRTAQIGPVALLVVFLPEVRQWVMEMGTGSFWRGPLFSGAADVGAVIGEIVEAVEQMSRARQGALIVIERRVGLDDIATTGRRLDSLVSSELLQTIFYPGSALHDGAGLIRENRLIAAGCMLPMPATNGRSGGRTAHTRHTAAYELAQQTDALIIVVSEESGAISVAGDRLLKKGLSPAELRDRLRDELGTGEPTSRFNLFRRWP